MSCEDGGGDDGDDDGRDGGPHATQASFDALLRTHLPQPCAQNAHTTQPTQHTGAQHSTAQHRPPPSPPLPQPPNYVSGETAIPPEQHAQLVPRTTTY